jgi:biopolymer transport protein ExbD
MSVTLARGRDRKSAAQIFTASMADIVFLLIVFYVVTYKVEVDRTRMDLPDTWIRVNIPDEDEKPAVISIAPRSEGYLIRVSTGKEMSLPVSTDEEIVTFASTEVARSPEKAFIIKADAEVPYERFDAVLDALKQSKARNIYLLSEQRTRDE